jgi:antitoxin (DNA-binding transcriptional repressor) of toxin-antitoxin stability system
MARRCSMADEIIEVSAFQAKTRLSELLRETERGRSFVIRRRGKVVAHLVPPTREEELLDLPRLLTSFREIRQRLPGVLKVRELIEEGRRT